MMKHFAKIAESRLLFSQKISVIDARLSSKYGSGFTNTLLISCFIKIFFKVAFSVQVIMYSYPEEVDLFEVYFNSNM